MQYFCRPPRGRKPPAEDLWSKISECSGISKRQHTSIDRFSVYYHFIRFQFQDNIACILAEDMLLVKVMYKTGVCTKHPNLRIFKTFNSYIHVCCIISCGCQPFSFIANFSSFPSVLTTTMVPV